MTKLTPVKGYQHYLSCCNCGRSEHYARNPRDWFEFETAVGLTYRVCGPCSRKQSGGPQKGSEAGPLVEALLGCRQALNCLLTQGALPAGDGWEEEIRRLIARADVALEAAGVEMSV
jgi:hypothetical protein